MLTRSRLAAAAASVAVVAATATAVIVHSTTSGGLVAGSHGDMAITVPGYQGLTADQKLDRALSLPGMHAVIAGHTGSPTTHTIPDSHGYKGTTVVTDFPFTVTRVITRGRSAYAVGEVVTLRMQGGSADGLTMSVDDSPSVPAKSDVFVFDRDQGIIAGGSSNSVLVVSNPADVFTVRGTTVVGQGPFVNVAEPLDRFVSHFSG